MGHTLYVARNFADYHDVKRNSGAAVLQSVNYLDDVSHRIIFAGVPSNCGPKVKKSDAEWQAYPSKQKLNLIEGGSLMVIDES